MNRQPELPLFHHAHDLTLGVIQSDIDLWLTIIPRIEPDSPRAAEYVKNWDVRKKIIYAKMTGDWPPER